MSNVQQVYSEGHKKWLSDDLELWRYVPLKTLFFYLSGNIFIPSIEKLRRADPFEGEFYFGNPWFNRAMLDRYGANVERIEDWIRANRCNESERQTILRSKSASVGPFTAVLGARTIEHHYFDFIRKTRYAWCWFQASAQSAAMWNIYGAHGAAIATSVGRLRKALAAQGRNFIFSKMSYVNLINQRTELNPGDDQNKRHILEPYFLKRNEYESESEVRFVAIDHENHNTNIGGIVLNDFAPKNWIDQIFLWPKIVTSEAESLTKIIEKITPGIRCSRSDLLNDSSELSGVAMHFIFSESDDKKWKDRDDGIPSEMKRF